MFCRLVRYNKELLKDQRKVLIDKINRLLLEENGSIKKFSSSIKYLMESMAALSLLDSSVEETTSIIVHTIQPYVSTLRQSLDDLHKGSEAVKSNGKEVREMDLDNDLYMRTYNVVLAISDYFIALEEMKGKPESMAIVTVFTSLWQEFIRKVIEHFASLERIQEAVGKIIKSFQKTCREGFKPFLEDYLSLIVECFRRSKLQTFIYSFETSIKCYANEEMLKPYFVKVLDIFITMSLQDLQTKD